MKKILILTLLLFAGASITFGQEKASSKKLKMNNMPGTSAEKQANKSVENLIKTISAVDPELAPTVLQQRQLKNYYTQKYMSDRFKGEQQQGKLTKQLNTKTPSKISDILTPKQMKALGDSKKKAKKTKPKE